MSQLREYASGVAGLKRRTKFTPYRESFDLARKIDAILDLLDGIDLSPENGVLRILEFFRTDEGVFGTCDDSSGSVGDVYRDRACAKLVEYASACPEKYFLADALIDLIREGDRHGIRHNALEVAGHFLPREHMLYVLDYFESEARDGDWGNFVCAHTIAEQLDDGPIMERVHGLQGKELGTWATLDIAKAWFMSGHPETALSWLDRVSATESFQREEREALRTDIYEALGRREERDALLWKAFRSGRSASAFEALLDRLGVESQEMRESLLADEVHRVISSTGFSTSDLLFLMDTSHIADAARWCYDVRDQIGGHAYWTLPELAKRFYAADAALAATILWRALLDDLLGLGRTRAYGHGARYLKKLREAATRIADWHELTHHDDYERDLREQHGRKSSFWRRVDPGVG